LGRLSLDPDWRTPCRFPAAHPQPFRALTFGFAQNSFVGGRAPSVKISPMSHKLAFPTVGVLHDPVDAPRTGVGMQLCQAVRRRR
jgi:hypothetical protein